MSYTSLETRPEGFKIFSSIRYDPSALERVADTIVLHVNGSSSQYYLLRYHRDRLLEAAKYFKWPIASSRLEGESGLEWLENGITLTVSSRKLLGGPMKLRALIGEDGELMVESSTTPAVPALRLCPSDLSPSTEDVAQKDKFDPSGDIRTQTATEPWRVYMDSKRTTPSPFTRFKTTSRSMYSEARARAGIVSPRENAEVILVNLVGEVMEGSITNIYLFRNGQWVTPPLSSGGLGGTTRRLLLERGLCTEEVIKASDIRDGEHCWLSNGVRGLIWGTVTMSQRDEVSVAAVEDQRQQARGVKHGL